MAWKILQSICLYNILILTALGRPGGRSSINLNDASEYAKIEQMVTKANAELGPANGIADPSSYRQVLIDATKQVVAGYSYEINYFLHKSFCFELLVFAIISFRSLTANFSIHTVCKLISIFIPFLECNPNCRMPRKLSQMPR